MKELYPLCVDLDGTLVREDVLTKVFTKLTLGSPFVAVQCLLAIGFGRAVFKRKVAKLAEFDPHWLTFNHQLIDRLMKVKTSGRRVVLATGADEIHAEGVARYLGIFDAVVASDGARNMIGEAKAMELIRLFGYKGYDYVGNGPRDMPVWRTCRKCWIVSRSRRLIAAVRSFGEVEYVQGGH